MATDDAGDPPQGSEAGERAAGEAGAERDRDREHRDRDREGPPRDRDLSESLRQRLEALVPDLVRRTFTAGLGAVFSTEDSLRKLTKDLNVPAVAGYLGEAADNTKDKVLEIIAREVREFLGQMNLSEEIARLLTTLSFEVKTEIRFIPNSERYSGVEPDVKAAVRVKRSDRAGERPAGERPAGERAGERPAGERPAGERERAGERDDDDRTGEYEARDRDGRDRDRDHDDEPAGRLRRLWRRATEAGREAVEAGRESLRESGNESDDGDDEPR